MTRADGKRQRAVQARKAERERVRAERKQAKLDKRTGAAAAPPAEGEGMSRKRKAEPETIRQGVLRAVDAVVEQGGAVLFGLDRQPFAFYPPRGAPDPGAPERLRELVERRAGEGG
jgi:hypothetical protein